MKDIIKRLLFIPWAMARIILFGLLIIPAVPYWILTGKNIFDVVISKWDNISPI